MLTRREWLTLTAGTGMALALDRAQLLAQQPLLTRAIPSRAGAIAWGRKRTA